MPEPTPAHFPIEHEWDRNFFLLFIIIAWIAVIMGFGPAVLERLQGKADYPAPMVLQLHSIVFLSWLGLLTVQGLLIRRRQHRLHRALGLSALFFIPTMLVVSFLAERYSQHFYSIKYPSNLNFFAVPLNYLIMFGVFSGWALVMLRRPDSHKRLMLMANSIILGVPFARWWGDTLYNRVGDGFWGMILHTYAGTEILLLLLLGHDLITRRRLHPVYWVGVPLILLSQLLVSWLYHSSWWPPIVKWIVGL